MVMDGPAAVKCPSAFAPDRRSSTLSSARVETPDYGRALNSIRVKRLRVGVARPFFYEELHPEIAQALEAALDILSSLTAGTFDVPLEGRNETTLDHSHRCSSFTNSGHIAEVGYGSGHFVVVGEAGAVAVSIDGVTSTQRPRVATNDLIGVAYGASPRRGARPPGASTPTTMPSKLDLALALTWIR
jgi:hypothetical protein